MAVWGEAFRELPLRAAAARRGAGLAARHLTAGGKSAPKILRWAAGDRQRPAMGGGVGEA